ncbi:response regulator [Streptomyces sp. NPDC056227]|uniref:response regulator n=1 Tax=Streptomyces sp. NPDC056227 TaxID=3345753 RepID=UPI0035D7C093
MRILIAEDEPFLTRTLAAGLRQQSLAVDVAADGAQVLERLAATAYDVLILDRDLSVVHGVTGGRRGPGAVAQPHRTSHTRSVLTVSGRPRPSSVRAASGASAVVLAQRSVGV